MRIGTGFPMHEIGDDPAVMRDFVQAAEGMGYAHLTVVDHIVGVHMPSHPGYEPIKTPYPLYQLRYPFREVFVLLGFVAAITTKIELVSQILILPQRQTALVAKQAAEVDILSKGRLRLGVAVGHTDLEYEALGIDFDSRGERIEEQIQVMRLLWTQEKVDFHGKFHKLDGVGINPLPIQRPIPIWMGGSSERVYRRAARVADGMAMPPAPVDMLPYLRAAGRDPAKFGMTGNVAVGRGDISAAVAQAKVHEKNGVTHLGVGTQRAGFTHVHEHIDALRRFKVAYGF